MNKSTNPFINFKEGMTFLQVYVIVMDEKRPLSTVPVLWCIILPWQELIVQHVTVDKMPGLDLEHFRVDLKLTSCNAEKQEFVFEPISEFIKVVKPTRIELEENGKQIKAVVESCTL